MAGVAVQYFDQLQRLLFHLDDEFGDLALKIAIEDEAGDGDREPGGGSHQDFRNAAGQLRGIGDGVAGRREGGEHFHHAQHAAQQSEVGRNRGDGAERVEVALKLMHDMTAGEFDILLHGLPPLRLA